MQTVHIAICDDNHSFCNDLRKQIGRLLADTPHTFQMFDNGESLLFALEQQHYSMLLLDIQMPGDDGITVARNIRKKLPDLPIILITQYDRYIYDGYEIRAVQYLIKPVDCSKLKLAMERALQLQRTAMENIITLKNNSGITLVNVNDILYIERFGRQTLVHTQREDIPVRRTIDELEQLKWPYFLRVDSGILLNVSHVKGYDRTLRKAVLRDNRSVSVSRRRQKILFEMLIDHTSVTL